MAHKEYLIVPLGERSPKAIFKELASSETILKGYTRFVLPHGCLHLSMEQALEVYENHDRDSRKIHRNGTSFLLFLETDELFFYVDSQSSLPVYRPPVYEVRIDLKGIDYVYEIPTYHSDAEEQALADLFSRVGKVVEKACVVSVRKINRNPPVARGPF